MARRVSRRKEPLREKHMLKEQTKVDAGIFDEKTMISLSKFFNLGIIERLGSPIARGKEADLYLADPGKSEKVKGMKQVVMKFFRIETSSFFKMESYIIGDPRFQKKTTRRSKHGIVLVWCKKEFGNLKVAERAGVAAPIPLLANGSILAMSYIGDEKGPAPRLKEAELDNPVEILEQVLLDIKKLHGKRLVHADVSEYNILIHEGKPYMIDFGQAVSTEHPNATEFLRRDIRNIVDYFSKRYGVEKDREEAYKWIVGSG